MRQYIFIISFIISIILNSRSSSVFSKDALGTPEKYKLPVDEKNIAPTGKVFQYQRWIVYAAQNSKTYKQPAVGHKYRKIIFLEKFYVKAEKGDWIYLVKDPEITEMTFSKKMTNYGWIHKKNMLLWSHCLATKTSNINCKAMILNTVEHVKNISEQGNPDKVEFREGPLNNDPLSGYESNLFSFFFVYKTTDDAVLLGKEERIPKEIEAKDIIVGWAPRRRITLWNHRICVEPNWEPAAVSERKQGRKAKFFLDEPSAENYKKNKQVNSSNIVWNSDPFENRPIGEWRRFPLLLRLGKKKRDDDIFTAGVMGQVHTTKNETFSAEEIAKLQRKLDLLLAQQRQVNIAFVVDASSSMNEYFPQISKAISKSMAILSDSRNNFRFGIVAYRDWAEKQSNRLLQVKRISDSAEAVAFLNRVDVGDTYDKDKPEAVYFGLLNALRGLGLDKKQTNVIILIGDAGNHHRNDGSQVNPAKIVNLLSQMRCHFLALQVHHESHSSYDDFNTQIKSLMMNAALENYRSYIKISKSMDQGLKKPRWRDESSLSIIENGSYVALLYGLSDKNRKLKPKLVSAKIEKFISYLDKRNNRLVAAIQRIIEGNIPQVADDNPVKSEFSSSLASGIIAFLRDRGLNDRDLNIVKKKKYQLYLPASSTMKVAGQTKPLFKKLLLLSKSELYNLWMTIQKLTISSNSASQRQDMYNTWKTILKTYLGEAQVDTLSFQRINETVFGLPGTSKLLSEVRLKDILDKRVVDDRQFAKYLESVVSKERGLRKIYQQDRADYRYSFRSNEQPYYWIEEDKIP